MDRLTQFTALCVNPKFEFSPSAPYREVRAIWTLWRICQDLRAANRNTIVVRVALPFVTALLVLLFFLLQFSIGAISLIFAIIIATLAFLIMLYSLYWLLAPSHIFEIQRQRIQEQNHCMALIKQNDTHRYNEKVNRYEQHPIESEEKIRNIIRGLYAQNQQHDSNSR